MIGLRPQRTLARPVSVAARAGPSSRRLGHRGVNGRASPESRRPRVVRGSVRRASSGNPRPRKAWSFAPSRRDPRTLVRAPGRPGPTGSNVSYADKEGEPWSVGVLALDLSLLVTSGNPQVGGGRGEEKETSFLWGQKIGWGWGGVCVYVCILVSSPTNRLQWSTRSVRVVLAPPLVTRGRERREPSAPGQLAPRLVSGLQRTQVWWVGLRGASGLPSPSACEWRHSISASSSFIPASSLSNA